MKGLDIKFEAKRKILALNSGEKQKPEKDNIKVLNKKKLNNLGN